MDWQGKTWFGKAGSGEAGQDNENAIENAGQNCLVWQD